MASSARSQCAIMPSTSRAGAQASGSPRGVSAILATASAWETFKVGKPGSVGSLRKTEARDISSSVSPLFSGPKTKPTRSWPVSCKNAGRSARASARRSARPRSEDVATMTPRSATARGSVSKRCKPSRTSSAPEASRCASSSAAAAGSTNRRDETPKFLETRAIEPRLAGSRSRTEMTVIERGSTEELSGPFVPYWRRMNPRLALPWAAFLVLLAGTAVAQEKPNEKERLPTYTESAGSEYVLVPVVVLDKKGRFVEGLEKKNF